MFDLLYRFVLIVAAAVIGGLLLYWMVPDLTPHIGENGAALWSWTLIIACGVVAYWLLPKTNLAHVSRVLSAILASAAAAMVAAAIINFVFDFPLDEEAVPQVVLIGFCALAFASTVYFPIYVIQRRLARAAILTYIVAGMLIPAACIFFYRPFGDADVEGNILSGVILGLIGVCSAIAFVVVAHRRPRPFE